MGNRKQLRELVRDEIREHVDDGDWMQHKLAEEAELETLKTVVENMKNAGA